MTYPNRNKEHREAKINSLHRDIPNKMVYEKPDLGKPEEELFDIWERLPNGLWRIYRKEYAEKYADHLAEARERETGHATVVLPKGEIPGSSRDYAYQKKKREEIRSINRVDKKRRHVHI